MSLRRSGFTPCDCNAEPTSDNPTSDATCMRDIRQAGGAAWLEDDRFLAKPGRQDGAIAVAMHLQPHDFGIVCGLTLDVGSFERRVSQSADLNHLTLSSRAELPNL